jgi:hypothetical protein
MTVSEYGRLHATLAALFLGVGRAPTIHGTLDTHTPIPGYYGAIGAKMGV